MRQKALPASEDLVLLYLQKHLMQNAEGAAVQGEVLQDAVPRETSHKNFAEEAIRMKRLPRRRTHMLRFLRGTSQNRLTQGATDTTILNLTIQDVAAEAMIPKADIPEATIPVLTGAVNSETATQQTAVAKAEDSKAKGQGEGAKGEAGKCKFVNCHVVGEKVSRGIY